MDRMSYRCESWIMPLMVVGTIQQSMYHDDVSRNVRRCITKCTSMYHEMYVDVSRNVQVYRNNVFDESADQR